MLPPQGRAVDSEAPYYGAKQSVTTEQDRVSDKLAGEIVEKPQQHLFPVTP
jgi:hypothetical protein